MNQPKSISLVEVASRAQDGLRLAGSMLKGNGEIFFDGSWVDLSGVVRLLSATVGLHGVTEPLRRGLSAYAAGLFMELIGRGESEVLFEEDDAGWISVSTGNFQFAPRRGVAEFQQFGEGGLRSFEQGALQQIPKERYQNVLAKRLGRIESEFGELVEEILFRLTLENQFDLFPGIHTCEEFLALVQAESPGDELFGELLTHLFRAPSAVHQQLASLLFLARAERPVERLSRFVAFSAQGVVGVRAVGVLREQLLKKRAWWRSDRSIRDAIPLCSLDAELGMLPHFIIPPLYLSQGQIMGIATLLAEGRTEDAEELCRIEGKTLPWCALQQAVLARARNDFSTVVDVLSTLPVSELDPEQQALCAGLRGEIAQEVGDRPRAVQEFELALRLAQIPAVEPYALALLKQLQGGRDAELTAKVLLELAQRFDTNPILHLEVATHLFASGEREAFENATAELVSTTPWRKEALGFRLLAQAFPLP